MNDIDAQKCDFCKKPATKDAKLAGMSAWAYVCDDCFLSVAPPMRNVHNA